MCYMDLEDPRHIIEATIAMEKKEGVTRSTGLIRAMAAAKVGGQHILDHLVSTGDCQSRHDKGMDFYFIKEIEDAWAFTTTHLPFTLMKSFEYN